MKVKPDNIIDGVWIKNKSKEFIYEKFLRRGDIIYAKETLKQLNETALTITKDKSYTILDITSSPGTRNNDYNIMIVGDLGYISFVLSSKFYYNDEVPSDVDEIFNDLQTMSLNSEDILKHQKFHMGNFKLEDTNNLLQSVTDGKYTFGELHHCIILMLAFICNTHINLCWKTCGVKIDDSPNSAITFNYFLVGLVTPLGEASIKLSTPKYYEYFSALRTTPTYMKSSDITEDYKDIVKKIMSLLGE